MNDTNIESKMAKTFCVLIDGINKVVPIQSLETINCFYRWLDSYNKLNTFGDDYIQTDYYNGSENDIVNLFLEIQKLATTDHYFNGNYVLRRLQFLANEGLQIATIYKDENPTFKVTEKEADEILAKYSRHHKTLKKDVKTSKKKKPVKRLMRDNKGRFIKNK